MVFRTEIDIKDNIPLISHDSSILTLGSCFATEIGNVLEKRLYDILVNPTGPLYNPISIENIINHVVSKKSYLSSDLVRNSDGGLFHSLYHHSVFSNEDANKVLDKINRTNDLILSYLRKDNLVVIITLGSARAFRFKSDKRVVANCHKLSSNLFETIDIETEEITTVLNKTISNIRNINNDSKIIFTVSPIRHKSYGLHNDKLSKAKLLIAVDRAIKEGQNLFYFPSYEIMMDDLRDYRFYAQDMLHPNDTAIEYIYGKFEEAYMDDKEKVLGKDCLALFKRVTHRPIIGSKNDSFNNKTGEIASEISSKYPKIQDALRRLKLYE